MIHSILWPVVRSRWILKISHIYNISLLPGIYLKCAYRKIMVQFENSVIEESQARFIIESCLNQSIHPYPISYVS